MRALVTCIYGRYYASFSEMPMIIGEGDTDAEARNDLADKVSSILGAVADGQHRLDSRTMAESLGELQRTKNALDEEEDEDE